MMLISKLTTTLVPIRLLRVTTFRRFLICFQIALEKRIAEILCLFPRDWQKFIIILPGLGLSTDGPSKIGLLLTVLEKDVASAILKNNFFFKFLEYRPKFKKK